MPANAKSYLLTPGSVLYVPRGYLHQVTSVDDADSLSLNICVPPTPWAVILCTLLGVRLLELPDFRDSLLGAFGSGWGREGLLERLPQMMMTFCQHAEAIGDDFRSIMDDPKKLEEYLAKRGYPLL
jgi:ribosomal protein L16 Arg81 hydroxylase